MCEADIGKKKESERTVLFKSVAWGFLCSTVHPQIKYDWLGLHQSRKTKHTTPPQELISYALFMQAFSAFHTLSYVKSIDLPMN